MLTKEERAEIRGIIESEIKRLEESLESHRDDENPATPDMAVGRLSRMDSLVNRGTLEMAMAEARKKLTRLHDKLERINDPDFGKCARCGEWIPMERLRAAPDRGVCVPCMGKK